MCRIVTVAASSRHLFVLATQRARDVVGSRRRQLVLREGVVIVGGGQVLDTGASCDGRLKMLTARLVAC